jgi:hypothetical protein
MWFRTYYFHKVLIQPKSKGMQACMYELRLLSSRPRRTSWSLSWGRGPSFPHICCNALTTSTHVCRIIN